MTPHVGWRAPQDGVTLIAPHRSTRELKTLDSRHLQQYEHRRLAERCFAGLQ